MSPHDLKDYNTNSPSLVARGRTVLGQPISMSAQPPLPFASYPASEDNPQASQTMIWTNFPSINDSLGVSMNGDKSYTTLDIPTVTVIHTESTWVVTFSISVTGDGLEPPELATTFFSITTYSGSTTASTSAMSTEPPATFTTLSASTLLPSTPDTNQSVPTNGTSLPRANSINRSVVVGPVVGILVALLFLLTLFFCHRHRLLCFRGLVKIFEPTNEPWSGTREDDESEKSTVRSMGEIQAFPPFELGGPNPSVTANDLAHLPSKTQTLSEIVAARTVTPPPPAAAHGPQMQNKRTTVPCSKHARTISDTAVCSSAPSDPFRTPATADEQTLNISQATFCSSHAATTTSNTHQASDPLPRHHFDSEADKCTDHNNFLSTAPPRSKSPTQPCPLIPSQVIPYSFSSTDNSDFSRRNVVRRASSLSSTSTKSHQASEKFANAETLYIGKARHMNLHSLRRHSLTPRIVNIMTHRTCSTVFEPLKDLQSDEEKRNVLANVKKQTSRRAVLSGRARSVSPVRSVRISGASASLYSGSPIKLGRYFDIHSHMHGQDYRFSHTWSERSGVGLRSDGEGEGEQRKQNGASRAYNQMVADINR